ncbi:hypothetical protein SAMN04488020_104125 [Palleronia marisminoris]|uniref:Uncharacterized protein n=1 Tax=Palleronia marisminoris TaxID=315423 RepID=A0A1Y5SIE3_9RHOB|nr:hypothetical protein [Palleronia marisminoris]SFG83015.1 hypothetical protein SAMN04488020_104125 [Palleronia marisminoris]SLN40835.1 hypothetical protein PAM7066_01748 [Palleronia marisminoris]
MDLSLGIAISAPSFRPGARQAGRVIRTVMAEPFGESPAIFDSGAARGVNSADIPLSGTSDALDGAQVEARIVRSADGVEVHPWATIATVTGGAWSGAFPFAMRNAHRLRAELRVAGESVITRMGDEFLVGHVVCLIGQSEDSRMFHPVFDDRRYQTVPSFAENSLFVLTWADHGAGGSYGANGIVPVSQAAPLTASLAHFAAVFAANAPGEPLLLIDATEQGTSRTALVDDSNPDRDWQATLADAVEIVRGYGGDVGVVMDTWTASDSAPGDNFRVRFHPVYSGARIDGSVFPLGGVMSDGGTSYRIDHFLWDLTGHARDAALFDAGVTKLAFHGPHRFEDFTMDAQGNYIPGLRAQKQDTRMSIRAMAADPQLAPIMRPRGPEILLYQNGTPTTATEWDGIRFAESFDPEPNAWVNWADAAHPSAYTDDGLPARARHTAVAALYALGRVSTDVPVLNRAAWTANHVDLWWEDARGRTPRLSTTRLERGEPSPVEPPHMRELAGFFINGKPADTTKIVDGRIRVYPNTGTFDGTTRLDYGLGGASGVVAAPDDEFAAIWKDLPLAVVGISGIEGVAVAPMPDQEAIRSTLPAAAQFLSSGDVILRDIARIPSNTTAITWHWRVRPTLGTVSQDLGGVEGARVTLQRLPDGKLRLLMMDAGGLISVPSMQTTLALGVLVDLVVSIDLAAGRVQLWKDGLRAEDLVIKPNVATFETNRNVQFLTGGSNGFTGGVDRMSVWYAGCGDGGIAALGQPFYSVSGQTVAPYIHEAGTGFDGVRTWLVAGTPKLG